MYAIGSSARRGFASVDPSMSYVESSYYQYGMTDEYRAGFGVIPAIAVTGGISLLSSLFGSHSGKTTHAQRFLAAQAAGDTATARLLIDQAYSHAFLENISDKADWMQVWQVMLNEANPANRAYMNAKLGIGSTPGSGSGVPGTPVEGGLLGTGGGGGGGFLQMLFSPVGIAAALAIYFATRRR